MLSSRGPPGKFPREPPLNSSPGFVLPFGAATYSPSPPFPLLSSPLLSLLRCRVPFAHTRLRVARRSNAHRFSRGASVETL